MNIDKSRWQRVRFGDVVRLNTDRCAEPVAAGIKRYVGLEHIEPEDLRTRRWGSVEEGTTFTNYFRAGHVLFGKRRAYQRKIAVADFEGVCSSDIYVFEPKDGRLSPQLLPFICQSEAFYERAVGTSAGSLSPRTSWEQLANFEFLLPLGEAQDRVVDALVATAEAVEAYREAAKFAETQYRSVREHVFSAGQCRTMPLGDVLMTIEAGRSVVGNNRPPRANEYAVLKVSAVGTDAFRENEAKTLVDPADFMPEYSIGATDLLITRANTPELVGLACVTEQAYPNLMLSDKTLRLVPKIGVSRRLLREALSTEQVRQELKSFATGTGAAMKNISQAKLLSLPISLPSNCSDDSEDLACLAGVAYVAKALQQRLEQSKRLHREMANQFLTSSS